MYLFRLCLVFSGLQVLHARWLLLLERRSVRMGLRVRLVAIAPPAVPRDPSRPMALTVAISPPDRLRLAKTELRQEMVALAPPILPKHRLTPRGGGPGGSACRPTHA